VEGTSMSSEPVSRALPPNGFIDCRFVCRFSFNTEAPPEWPDVLEEDAGLKNAIDDLEARFQCAESLPENPGGFVDLTFKAAGTLHSLRYADFDPEGRRRMTIHVGKSGTAATWFWDTGIGLPGLGLSGETEAASGAIRTLIRGIRQDGTPPITYECQKYLYSYQIPLLTWGVGHYLSLAPDSKLLNEAYPALARYIQHWLDRFTSPLGLVAYPPGETSLDDALRWHSGSPLVPRSGEPWYQQDWGQMRQDEYLSPDVNAFLYLELQTLASMADAIGDTRASENWRTQAKRLAAAICEHLLEPTSRTYQDRHRETGLFTGLISMASFIPVYAGLAPADIASHHCRNYLLSKDHFLTTFPFPVVDRAHPTFRPGGFLYSPPAYPGALVQQSYWRGRTWLHGNVWMLGALWQSGFKDEAHELSRTILEGVSKNEAIYECYDSLTGFGNGHPEFLWSAASVLMLARNFYTRPPVAQLAAGPGRAV